MDAAIIGAAQRIEHYEIAGYGTVRTLAQLLGEDEHMNLLEQTLEEEKETDQKLTQLAENINPQAGGFESTHLGEVEQSKSNSGKSRRAA